MYKPDVVEILLWRFSSEEDSHIQISIHLRKITLLIILRGNIDVKNSLSKKTQPTNQKKEMVGVERRWLDFLSETSCQEKNNLFYHQLHYEH